MNLLLLLDRVVLVQEEGDGVRLWDKVLGWLRGARQRLKRAFECLIESFVTIYCWALRYGSELDLAVLNHDVLCCSMRRCHLKASQILLARVLRADYVTNGLVLGIACSTLIQELL